MMNAYALADTILSDWLLGAEGEVYSVPLEQVGFGLGNFNVIGGGSGEEGDMVPNPDVHLTELPREVAEGMRSGKVVMYEDWKKVGTGCGRREGRRGGWEGEGKDRVGGCEGFVSRVKVKLMVCTT